MNAPPDPAPASAPESRLFPPLRAVTPTAWLERASRDWRELLLDHANCEKKAASTALSLLFTYAEDLALTAQLSRLAREELRHFEQVQRLMVSLEVPFQRLSPSRYADGLRRAARADEPGRCVDLLICGGLIEARSCERFAALAPLLPQPVASFYRTLSEAEVRHFAVYFELAGSAARADEADLSSRVAELADIEAELITTPDAQFRFHSGVPATRG
jgi:tRNA-(ms[2]io[6]A)-hydroxylase